MDTEERDQKDHSIKNETRAQDCGLINIFLILTHLKSILGRMDTGREARRLTGVPAQTSMPHLWEDREMTELI